MFSFLCILDEISQKSSPGLLNLPYRLVFAVASEDSVLFYDTEQSFPFGYVSNIHYHTLSDISWYVMVRFLKVVVMGGGEERLSFLYSEALHNFLCLALFLCFIYDMSLVTVIVISKQVISFAL